MSSILGSGDGEVLWVQENISQHPTQIQNTERSFEAANCGVTAIRGALQPCAVNNARRLHRCLKIMANRRSCQSAHDGLEGLVDW